MKGSGRSRCGDRGRGERFSSMQRMDNIEELYERCKSKEFYIIWHEELPVIKSDIGTIISNIYDICAVEFDTWVFSTDYSEIIEFYHEGEITYGVVKENPDSPIVAGV